jgi:dTMP kinase
MYDTPTGKRVASYLNGEMGTSLSADEAGKLYQNDRLANKGQIIEWLKDGKIVLLDRYVESNSGHQGGKLPTREKRIEHIMHNAEVEYIRNDLPVPDVTLLFTLPPELAKEYVARKSADSRTYTTLTHDIHEADAEHLKNANEAFALLLELYPKRIKKISVTSNDVKEMRSKELIQSDIRLVLEDALIQKTINRI